MFIKQVIDAFQKHHVKYALVGGYAVALHGAIRGTVDIDFVIQLNRSQFEAAEKALIAIGLQPRLPVTAAEVFDFREEYIRNKNLIAWSFQNPSSPLEMVDILITHDMKAIKTVGKKVDRLMIQVASIPDLMAMKKQAGRAQDLEDIKALEKLQ
jgi:hypothetical protein